MATVRTGARLHLGFQNLSLAHERLYGGVGLALAEPTVAVTARPAGDVVCEDAAVEPVVADAVAALGVDGAAVRVEDRFERHVGLGSGTQLALSCLVAVAAAHEEPVDVRELAPAIGRGGRSGVGVATFEAGGFVVDAGHPSQRFTAEPPPAGEWTVPSPIVRSTLPPDWRFVLVQPEAEPGPSGRPEDERMRAVVERADPGIADEIATLLTRRLLPAVAEGDHRAFGRAAAPAGRIVEALGDEPAVSGTGQSSWGPTVYGVTDADGVEAGRAAGRDALDDLGLDGSVRAVRPRNEGARGT